MVCCLRGEWLGCGMCGFVDVVYVWWCVSGCWIDVIVVGSWFVVVFDVGVC